jgi:predicted N-acetyltransferase YhbS
MPPNPQTAPALSDLRRRPEFLDTVADRVWRAWWRPYGHPLSRIVDGLQEHLADSAIPFTLVAHDGDAYAGSTLVIASDLDERPQYSPWVAAVWVDPAYRERGTGAALVEAAARATFALGVARVYLSAGPLRRAFYAKRGWTPIEEHVGPHDQTVFVRDAR